MHLKSKKKKVSLTRNRRRSNHFNNIVAKTLPTEKTTKFHVTGLGPRSNLHLSKEEGTATNQSMLIPA